MSFTYKIFRTPAMRNCESETNHWPFALDEWSQLKASGSNPIIHLFGEGYDRVLNSEGAIKEWSDWLLLNRSNYNRVEKRLIKELKEEKEKSFEELMFGNTHFKSESSTLIPQEEDGMEIVEPKEDVRFRDEIPNLMGKVFEKSKNVDFHGDFENMSGEQQNDIINPKHYKMIPKEAYDRFPKGLEYMDLMEYILEHHRGVKAHLLGQIFKYACRLGKKDSKLQDARKIEWYASRLVEVIENDR